MQHIQVFLVPGFFGFTSLGAFSYFHRVADTLGSALRERGFDARVVETRTQPTGSLSTRADRLLEDVLAAGALDADAIHFVGHSTGGLDVRLLVTPGVRLRGGDAEERVASRTRSVITVATPHFGTPLANFFTTLPGRQILRLLAVLATSNEGRYGLFAVAQLAQLLARADDWLGRRDTFLDQLSARLLQRLSPRRDDPVWRFVRDVGEDQGAIIQLTPEGMNLFNAAVADRPGVSYRSVATAAPPPSRTRWREFRSPQRLAGFLVFSAIYGVSSRRHRQYPYPSPARTYEAALRSQLPIPLDSATNDGIVPTLSQLYGEPLMAVLADHLDVVGQFHNAGGDPLSDWLPSGADFDEARFQEVWAQIADAIAADSAPPRAG